MAPRGLAGGLTAGEHQARRLEHPVATARVDRLARRFALEDGRELEPAHIDRARRALASIGGARPALELVRT